MLAQIRPFRTGDEEGIVSTVREVFDEYGFSWDEKGYCSDLYDPTSNYLNLGGAFWVAESNEGRIVGCVAYLPHGFLGGVPGESVLVDGKVRAAATDCSLERLYLRPKARGYNLGQRLSETVRLKATESCKTAIELWSDKKLEHAHRLYERLGAIRIGDRICDDPDESPEWGFYWRV